MAFCKTWWRGRGGHTDDPDRGGARGHVLSGDDRLHGFTENIMYFWATRHLLSKWVSFTGTEKTKHDTKQAQAAEKVLKYLSNTQLSAHQRKMSAFSIEQDICSRRAPPPTPDKSLLVTLDPQTAVDSSSWNSMQYNEWFKFSVYSYVCNSLMSFFYSVIVDTLTWDPCDSPKGTPNQELFIKLKEEYL